MVGVRITIRQLSFLFDVAGPKNVKSHKDGVEEEEEEEEDLQNLLKTQVLMLQGGSQLPECWQLLVRRPLAYHGGRRRGAGQHCTIERV